MCGNVWCSSSGPLPAEDELHRVEEDAKIELRAHVLDVVEVVAELPRDLFHAHRVSRAHLGPAGESRPHLVTFSAISGRGPTRLMSPRRMLMNCGISSRR